MKKYLISLMPARTIFLPVLAAFGFLFPSPVAAKYEFLKKPDVVAVQAAASNPVHAEMISFDEPSREGQPLYLGIRIDVQKGWKTYWKNPGESGYPVSVDWELPAGYEVEALYWPTPSKSIVQDRVVYGYSEPVTLIAKLKAGKGPATGIRAHVNWLVCNDETCLPGEAQLTYYPNGHGNLGAALQQMPQELADVEVRAAASDHVVLRVPQHVSQEVEFYPEEESTKEPVQFWSDAEGGSILRIPNHSASLKGVLHFKGGDSSVAYLIDMPVDNGFATLPYSGVSSFGMVLLFALAGGLILNLMPCVLPVVSLKVLSFINMAGKSRKMTLLHGSLFSAGVLLSFWVLAGIILSLRSLGHSVGWGFQLQNEVFVGILAALLLLLALWLFGVFELGFSLSAKSGDVVEKAKKSEKGKLFGSFLSGVLATAVATPCSGPFLGTALGVAVTVPALQSLSIFTCLGLGMASPYLLLAAYPKLLRFLPKPGPWMETFKQLMGFLMLLVVIWLTWVFVSQSDSSTVLPLLIGFLLLAFAAWTYGKVHFGFKKFATKAVLMGVALFSTFSGFYYILDAGHTSISIENVQPEKLGSSWEKFSPESIDQLRAEGKGVFVDFTAKWCLLCQANLVILNAPSIEQRMAEMGVVRMMADWTKSDPRITAELAKFGRNSVPLYVYYPPGKNSKPQILPQVLTQETILETLENGKS